MAEYIHGAYGRINAVGERATADGSAAFVIFGTAPVNMVQGGSAYVNKPIAVHSMNEARKYFGYSEDWAKYTICEAFHVFFDLKGVAPLIVVNVLDPVAHKSAESVTVSLTPERGIITIQNGDDVILDSVSVPGKELNKDYYLSFDYARNAAQIIELTPGALGTAAMQITYDTVDASKVTAADLIGASDGMGLNTGLYAIKNVYQETGYTPGWILAPGWSNMPAVHDVMYNVSKKVNSHWDAWMLTDLPLKDSEGTAINLLTAYTWKKANGYNHENETVSFPMVELTDDKHYHLSVWRAVNTVELLIENDGVPYHSASNTEIPNCRKLWFGADNGNRVIDDEIINNRLNANGICSAAFVGGAWALWGASSAAYDQETANSINVGETAYQMLFYVSNDFQIRRSRNVDEPITANDIVTIVAEEQERLDSLVAIGALTYGRCAINAKLMDKADVMMGDFTFDFNVTTTPLAKSLTAHVVWVNNGFETYFDAFQQVAG